jgi:hypothetical protein
MAIPTGGRHWRHELVTYGVGSGDYVPDSNTLQPMQRF